MDGTERITIGEAEAEFSRQHLEAYRKSDLEKIMMEVRDEALIGTIKKFGYKLDRVAVQLLKDGPFRMVCKIQEDLFFEPEANYFLKPIKLQSNVSPIVVVNPMPTEALTSQWVQQILMDISAKVKAGDGKIILPRDFYYFTWQGQAGNLPEFFYYAVVEAKNFDEAKSKIMEKISEMKGLSDLKVFYDNQWYKLALVADFVGYV